jgi:ATP-dependent helicase/nuclease subunit A
MTHALKILASASDIQKQAAHPQTSVWVSASAGTGKTKVLNDRILNLLLNGTPPDRILCLTFTNAAAAEMANRLQSVLGIWATCPLDELQEKLVDLLDGPIKPFHIDRARRLFAQVLDVPGGMKIQTIHSFCQSILAQFPLESGVSPQFKLLDEGQSGLLKQQALQELFLSSEAEHLTQSLQYLTTRLYSSSLIELVSSLLREQQKIQKIFMSYNTPEDLASALYKKFQLEPLDSIETVIAQVESETNVEVLEKIVDIFTHGSKTEQKRAPLIKAWVDQKTPHSRQDFEEYKGAFLTQDDTRYKSFPTKGTAEKYPHVVAQYFQEADRIEQAAQKIKAISSAERSVAFYQFAREFLTSYKQLKHQHHALDYDDLILKTMELLTQNGAAPWVLYKLDGGIDHILVDEAQDTNPMQWQVIQALADEFFTGASARQEVRTIFAVGDIKQSIYSFQKADPEGFKNMSQHFAQQCQGSNKPWRQVTLDVSFRSTPAVLSAVDNVFSDPQQELGSLEKMLEHRPFRQEDGGEVVIWPLIPATEKLQLSAWELPTKRQKIMLAEEKQAEFIAAQIEDWIKRGEILPSKNRPIHPGDITILTRRRTSPVGGYLIAALKRRHIPVAGVDRLILMEELAIQDLVALGDFLLLPQDDFSLAVVLKSPFVGVSEEELFELAYDRGEKTLWQRLQENQKFVGAADYLKKLLARVDFVAPYTLYSEILGPMGGAKKLRARLGPQVDDPVQEFMTQALNYEKKHDGSLQGFLQWLRLQNQSIKRDIDPANQTEVQLMTVHGSKGLQAPIVILTDTTSLPDAKQTFLEDEDFLYWCESKKSDPAFLNNLRDQLREKQLQEYNRLLYVAMTRAEDCLYISGWEGATGKVSDHCWYQKIYNGVQSIAEAEDFKTTFLSQSWVRDWQQKDLKVLKIQNAQIQTVVPPAHSQKAAINDQIPTWLETPAPKELSPSKPLMPSRLAEVSAYQALSQAEEEWRALQRGKCIHRLLEILPGVETFRHVDIYAHVFRQYPDLSGEMHKNIQKDVEQLLADPELTWIFETPGKSEVPIQGRLSTPAGEKIVVGRIDRLIITSEKVAIIDYKTNRHPILSSADLPEGYKAQLTAYGQLLEEIYPQHVVETYILWTSGPSLLNLPKSERDLCWS